MFVCLCRVVSDREVREAVDAGARTLEEVADACGAGAGCGACHEEIANLIEGCPRRGAAEFNLFQIAGLAKCG